MDETFETMTTDRLALRAATVDDVDVLFPITSDLDTWRHAPGGQHRDEQTTREWLARAASRWATDRLSYWIVRLRDSGETVGVGGVQRQATRNWNLYYRFAPGAWGNGHAIPGSGGSTTPTPGHGARERPGPSCRQGRP